MSPNDEEASMMSRGYGIRWVAALVLALAACSHGGTYHDSEVDFGAIRTVAILPFANLSRDQQAGERVRDVFSTQLLATRAVYVVPPGEVARGLSRVGVVTASSPSVEEVQKLGAIFKADAVITGVVREYGEVRSASSTANVVSLRLQMQETATGKVVWSASSTKGGVGMAARMFGGGGAPLNDVTEEACNELLDKLFK